MRVKFFGEGGEVFEIDAPEGTTIAYKSHERDEAGEFLDDVLIVPCKDKRIGVPGEVVPKAAKHRLLGLQLVRVVQENATQTGTSPP